MYTISDLQDTFGKSYDQIRNRIVNLESNFDDCVKRGQRGKYLVTERGLSILNQLIDLENQGHSLETATEVIKNDLKSRQREGIVDTKEPQANSELVRELRDRIDFLETQIEKKDDQIQQLLPAVSEENPPTGGPIKRFFDWLW